MIRDQLLLDTNHELIIDNFAGGGGASSGIEEALGRHVDHAINHDAFALGMHRINHPQTVHHCEDIFDIDPYKLTGAISPSASGTLPRPGRSPGRSVGFAWFSPDCKHFSKAKGGKPLDKKIRGLVLIMLRYAATVRPRVMAMENVEEIQTWGPLLANGKPDPAHKGRTWKAFRAAMGSGLDPNHPDIPEMLSVLNEPREIDGVKGPPVQPYLKITKEQLVRGFGYHGETKELRACDYGAPTIRKRLFAVWRCDGMPIVWPKPTHGDPKLVAAQKHSPDRVAPWRIIAECIDWSLSCPSIFLNKEQARKAKCKRPLKRNTLRRIAAGVDRYVLKAEKPFIISLTHQGGDRIESIDEPAKTLTAAHRGEKALVAPVIGRCAHGEPRGKGSHPATEPMGTQAATKDFSVIQAGLISDTSRPREGRNAPADEPMRTQCAEVKRGHLQLVTGTIVGAGGPARTGEPRPVTKPAHTLLVKNDSHLASVLMVQKGHYKSNSIMSKGANEPMRTQASAAEHGLVAAHLTKFITGSDGQPVTQPSPTIVAGSHSPDTHGGAASTLGMVAANMVKLRGDPETHAPGAPASDPLHTASAGGQHHALSACYLAQHNAGNNTNPGHPATEPASTINAKGSQQQIVSAAVTAYYGSEADGQPVTEPMRSATAKPRFALTQADAVTPGLTRDQLEGARRVAKFLRSFGVKFEGEFARVGDYIIVDLGMRMLTARELFRAQGFQNDYTIDRAWLVHPTTGEIREEKLTKESQIRMCGNSVSPPCARAITAANVPELAVWNQRERRAANRTFQLSAFQTV